MGQQASQSTSTEDNYKSNTKSSPDQSPFIACCVSRDRPADSLHSPRSPRSPRPADAPGTYQVISSKCTVRQEASLQSGIVGDISRDALITVLEVVTVTEDQSTRHRARISHPEGWITLLDLSNGVRFAKKSSKDVTDKSEQPMVRMPPPRTSADTTQGLDEAADEARAEVWKGRLQPAETALQELQEQQVKEDELAQRKVAKEEAETARREAAERICMQVEEKTKRDMQEKAQRLAQEQARRDAEEAAQREAQAMKEREERELRDAKAKKLAGTFSISVVCRRAYQLKTQNFLNKCEAYLDMYVSGADGEEATCHRRTAAVHDDVNPFWEETIELEGITNPRTSKLVLEVMDEYFTTVKMMGKAEVPLRPLCNTKSNDAGPLDMDLTLVDEKGSTSDSRLLISVSMRRH